MRAIFVASLAAVAVTLASPFALAQRAGSFERVARPAPDRVVRPAAERMSVDRVRVVRDQDRVRHTPPPTDRPSVRAMMQTPVSCAAGSAGCGGAPQARAEAGHARSAAASSDKKLDPAMVKAARAYLDNIKNMKCGARGRCE
ncbi:MAG: hypothetical protein JNL38_10455 [Myxococcales bacterium]|nr:hypothetical protein [Myxococcales bacterium]